MGKWWKAGGTGPWDPHGSAVIVMERTNKSAVDGLASQTTHDKEIHEMGVMNRKTQLRPHVGRCVRLWPGPNCS